MYTTHTFNEVWGLAHNPWNPERSVAGSSGGEAGLVASRCVVAGIGTDIGGSIRLPASFNGICGFKPTSKRTSHDGCVMASVTGVIE